MNNIKLKQMCLEININEYKKQSKVNNFTFKLINIAFKQMCSKWIIAYSNRSVQKNIIIEL